MESINETLTEDKEERKRNRMKAKTKKYLAIFLALMIVSTVVSRATASFTTPMVQTINAKRGSLTYKIQDTGSVEKASEVYCDVEEGLKVSNVNVKVGDSVEEDQVLFEYDLEVLNKKIKEAKRAVIDSEQAIKKKELEADTADEDPTVSDEQKAYDRAKEDYDAAVEALEKANAEYEKKSAEIKKNMSETQKSEYEEAKQKYEDAVDLRNETIETCNRTLDRAVRSNKTAKKTRESSIAAAQEELKDAQDSLLDLTKKRDQLEEYIKEFTRFSKSRDLTRIDNIKEKIFTVYFGKDKYEEIQKDIIVKQKALDQAKEAYQKMTEKCTRDLGKATNEINKYAAGSEEYKAAYDAYFEKQIECEDSIKNAKKAVDEAEDALNNVDKNYKEINQAANAYRDMLVQDSSAKNDTIYNAFYNAVIDEKVNDKRAIQKAENTAAKKQDAYNDTIAQQDALVADAELAVQDAKDDLQKKTKKQDEAVQTAELELKKVIEKDYSGETDLKSAWSSVEQQQGSVKTLKRSLDDAKEKLDKAVEKIGVEGEKKVLQDQITSVDMEKLNADLKDKKEILDRLKKVAKTKGKVKAKIAGRISNMDVAIHNVTGGTEKVSITPSSTVFTGVIEKDLRKYVEEGATIACKLDTQEKSVDAEILNIRYEAATNNYSFTAKLPDGNYMPGTGGTYNYTQQSQKYDAVLPMSAIRQGQVNQNYVLVLYETETVLGKETVAQKIPVEVISKDKQSAAVTNVYPDMQVITGSSRDIMEGDRVRVGQYE